MMENTILVLIDLQQFIITLQKLLRKQLTPHTINIVLANNQNLVDAAIENDIPIVFVRVMPPFIGKLVKKWGDILLPIPKNNQVEMLTKRGPDAFSNKAMSDLMSRYNVKNMIITGVSTDNGVLKTAKTAVQRGINIIAVEDAMSAASLSGHAAAIGELKRIASIMTTDGLLKEMKNNRG
jgi:nicotinamidase-related amidase